MFIFLTPGVNDNKLFEQLSEEIQIEEDTRRKVKKEKIEPDTDLSIFDIVCYFDGAPQKGVTIYAYIINERENRLVENYEECEVESINQAEYTALKNLLIELK